MKTLFSVVSVVAMLVMAAGCGSSNKDSSTDQQTLTCTEGMQVFYEHGCALGTMNLNGGLMECEYAATNLKDSKCSSQFDALLNCLQDPTPANYCTQCATASEALMTCLP
jgi:hypothetical protein